MLMGRIQRTWMMRREKRNIWVRFSWLIKNFSSLDMRETPSLAIFILLQQVKSWEEFGKQSEVQSSSIKRGIWSISVYVIWLDNNIEFVKESKTISPPPVVVVVQVDDAVCALLADGLGLGLDVVGAGGVHPDPLHDGQHPPDTTQEVQTGHNGNTQPGKESEVRFVKHLILESQGNKKVEVWTPQSIKSKIAKLSAERSARIFYSWVWVTVQRKQTNSMLNMTPLCPASFIQNYRKTSNKLSNCPQKFFCKTIKFKSRGDLSYYFTWLTSFFIPLQPNKYIR